MPAVNIGFTSPIAALIFFKILGSFQYFIMLHVAGSRSHHDFAHFWIILQFFHSPSSFRGRGWFIAHHRLHLGFSIIAPRASSSSA